MSGEARRPGGAERAIEWFIFQSRWLMAPVYLGLVFALLAVIVTFFRKLAAFATTAVTGSDSDVIVSVLSLIDLTLAGGLVLIVMFSGYENFVSKIDASEHTDWPDWMAKIDFTGIKLKLLSSIVAISAIQVLKAFMDVDKYTDRELTWLVVIHLVFVGSGVLLALTDRISEGKAPHH